MSSWKDLFIAKEEPKAPPAKKPVVEVASVGSNVDLNAAPAAPTQSGEGGLDVAAIEAAIEKSIKSAEAFGPFAKFTEDLDALKDVPGMDEPTKFRAAFATAKIPVAELAESLKSFEAAISAQTDKFGTAFVDASHAEIVRVSEAADAVGIEIEQVQAHLNDLMQKKAQLVDDASKRNSDLEKAKIDFAQVVKKVYTRYTDMTAKVTKHLGA